VPNWNPLLIEELKSAVQNDPFWSDFLARFISGSSPYAIHLAIFVKPYLDLVLNGRKTIESRFSSRRIIPYERVNSGDVVLLKESGGDIVGLCRIAYAWFYKLDIHSWQTIREEYTQALCAQDPDFWEKRKAASFATLMQLCQVHKISPIKISKRDRRGWVCLHYSQQKLEGVEQ